MKDTNRCASTIHRRIWATLALLAALCVASLCAAADAPPPLESFVPDGFLGTVSVNLRQALDAPELEALRSRVMSGAAGNVINQVFMVSGVDVMKDLDGVLVGIPMPAVGKEGALIALRGHWDAMKLVDLVRSNQKYEETAVGTQTMYSFWSDNDQMMRSAAFPAQDVMVIGNKDGVQKALGLVSGQTKARMTDQPAYQAALKNAMAHDSTVRLVVLAPPAQTVPNPVGQTLLGSAQALDLALTLNKGIHLEGELVATSEETARQWRDMVQGLVAYGQMQKQLPQVAVVAKKAVIGARGSSATATLDATMDEIGAVLVLHPALRTFAGQGPAMQEPVGVNVPAAGAANPGVPAAGAKPAGK